MLLPSRRFWLGRSIAFPEQDATNYVKALYRQA